MTEQDKITRRWQTASLWCLAIGFAIRPNPLHAQWYAQAYLGTSSAPASDLMIDQPSRSNLLTFHQVEYAGRSFDYPLYYGVRAGAVVLGKARAVSAAVELEFIHAKIYANPEQVLRISGTRGGQPMDSLLPFKEIVQQFSISHGTNFALVNVALHYGDANQRRAWLRHFAVSGRFGLGPTILHTESTIDGVRQEQYELNHFGLQLALGITLRLWQQLHLLGEYKFTYNQVHQAMIVEGAASTTLRMQHWVFGVGWGG